MATDVVKPSVRVRGEDSDVVQVTMTRALTALPQFRGATEQEFVAWLATILEHTAVNFIKHEEAKKRDVRKTINNSVSSACLLAGKISHRTKSPSHNLLLSERIVQLAHALKCLPENQRIAVEMRHLQQMPVREIARQLDATEEAVAGRIGRGMRKLRQIMSSDDSIGM
jgi:RNA polymerase sigma-70 factor (ECF subfamily)